MHTTIVCTGVCFSRSLDARCSRAFHRVAGRGLQPTVWQGQRLCFEMQLPHNTDLKPHCVTHAVPACSRCGATAENQRGKGSCRALSAPCFLCTHFQQQYLLLVLCIRLYCFNIIWFLITMSSTCLSCTPAAWQLMSTHSLECPQVLASLGCITYTVCDCVFAGAHAPGWSWCRGNHEYSYTTTSFLKRSVNTSSAWLHLR